MERPSSVGLGQSITIKIYYLPPGQKMHLDVDYPNGQTISIGDAYSVDHPDGPELQWTWTIPGNMTPGTANARWTGRCPTRVYDGSGTFIITVPPSPTPTQGPIDTPAPSF